MKMKFNYSLQIVTLAFLFIIQVKANDVNTEKNYNHRQKDDYNYASSFPYTSPLSSVNQNINSEQNTQRQVPLDFVNYDKFDKTEAPIYNYENENQEPLRRKPVIKFSEEQLNLPNPYLINSNIPKDGKEIPCPDFYYPCKTNFGKNEEQLNDHSNRPGIESSISKETASNLNTQSGLPDNSKHQRIPTTTNFVYPDSAGNLNNFYTTQTQNIRHQNSNPEGIFGERNNVLVICYGLECSSQIQTPLNNHASVQQKSNEFSTQPNFDSTTNNFIENFRQDILKAIINDLLYVRTISSKLSNSDKSDDNAQKIVIESEQRKPDSTPYYPSSSPTNNKNYLTRNNDQIYI